MATNGLLAALKKEVIKCYIYSVFQGDGIDLLSDLNVLLCKSYWFALGFIFVVEGRFMYLYFYIAKKFVLVEFIQ